MKPLHLLVVSLWLLTVTAILPAPAAAQAPRAPAPPSAPEAPIPPEAPDAPDTVEPPESSNDVVFDNNQDRVRVGQDFTLREGETANDVVVVMGNATIDGTTHGDVVVILGTVRIGSKAVIDGDFVAVGGSVRVEDGARVERDFTVVGGRADLPPDFSPGGQRVTVGGPFGMRFERFLPFFTRGLLWGRPIVPDLPWMWLLIGLSFFCYLVINQLADGPVAGTAATLMEKPLTAFGAGLLVLLLLGPVCLLLAISVVGLAVIPFVLCALVIAALVGKVGAIRWLGLQTMRQEAAETGGEAFRAFVIGFAILVVAYMIPVIGLATWAIVSVLGLGAATLAFMSAYRREQPRVATAATTPFSYAPPPIPSTYTPAASSGTNVAPPPPVPTPYQPVASANPASAANTATPTPGFASGAVPHLAITPNSAALLRRALFRERLAALVLDVILVILITQIFDLIDTMRGLFLGMLVYHIGFWTWKETTVGGMICHLRIVRADGAPLTFADALVRGLSGIFSVILLGLGFFSIIRDPEGQAWHDKVAGTFVVKVPQGAFS
jgi:uncharacterized RDD family membrane protein YckC